MYSSPFPWRDGRSLSKVLADGRAWFERKRIIKKGAGCPAAAIVDAEHRLGQPLPPDIRQFLFEVQPIPMFISGEVNNEGPMEFFFYGPLDEELQWRTLDHWTPREDWRDAQGLAIGQTGYGDLLLWVRGHRVHADGCIAIHDHEMAIGDLEHAVLARSLPEFLAKVFHLKGLSSGYADELDDDFDDLEQIYEDIFDHSGQELFKQEYAELNPASQNAP